MFFSKALQMDDTLGGIFDGVVSGINAAVSGSSGGSSINWNNVINQGFALASQGFNAFGGQNTGTQFAQGSGGIFALQSRPAYDDSYRYTPTTQVAGQTGGVGGAVGSGIDSLLGLVMTPTGLIVVGAIVLLFMRPPGKK